jgi:hypothetical protein
MPDSLALQGSTKGFGWRNPESDAQKPIDFELITELSPSTEQSEDISSLPVKIYAEKGRHHYEDRYDKPPTRKESIYVGTCTLITIC